jgi:hypothetical protein
LSALFPPQRSKPDRSRVFRIAVEWNTSTGVSSSFASMSCAICFSPRPSISNAPPAARINVRPMSCGKQRGFGQRQYASFTARVPQAGRLRHRVRLAPAPRDAGSDRPVRIAQRAPPSFGALPSAFCATPRICGITSPAQQEHAIADPRAELRDVIRVVRPAWSTVIPPISATSTCARRQPALFPTIVSIARRMLDVSSAANVRELPARRSRGRAEPLAQVERFSFATIPSMSNATSAPALPSRRDRRESVDPRASANRRRAGPLDERLGDLELRHSSTPSMRRGRG